MVDPYTELSVSEDVVFQELDGETVLLNIDSGVYFGLDEVATRIWQELERHKKIDKVVSILLKEYKVEEGRLRADVERFVEGLINKGLVTIGS